jgi:large subunit ribosomal protein L29
MNAQELRTKTPVELREELTSLLKEQFSLRMQKGTGQLPRPHEMKRVRRDIARVRTFLNQKNNEGKAA